MKKKIEIFYSKQGKYADGSDRVVIVNRKEGKQKTLPKPKDMWVILHGASK